MYSSIFFSALSSVSLLPLLNFLPFDFSEKTRTILVLVSYFSTSIICELRNENILQLELMNISRLCNKILAHGSAHVIFSLALTELHHVFLYSPITLTSNDETGKLVVSFVMGAISLNSIFQRNKRNIVTRQAKTSLLQVLFCFVVCHILPVVKYFNQTREKLPMGWKMQAIIYIFCDFVVHLVVFSDLVLLTGRKTQSDPCARSDYDDYAHGSPNRLSRLDDHCLERIVQQVTNYKDFVAFSEVCHSTREVCSNMEWDGGPKPPCLVLSEKPGCSSRPFFSLHNRHVFVLDIPAAVGRRIWGSQHGWLVTLGPEHDAQLMNPFSQVCVNLPPLPTMQNQLARGNLFHKVQKLFVFKTNIHPLKFLVIAILNPRHQLVFTRSPGDIGEWAFVSNPKEFFFRSVAYFEHQLYALCDNGSLIRIDFNGPITAKAEFVAPHPIQEYVGYQPHHEKTGRAYLVPSQDDLFGVFRYSSKDIGFERTVQFYVYKFDFESLEWKSVWSIEDKAFFVGNGNSWSINLSHTVNCNSNSIFYGDDMEGGFGLDNGIYDLETLQTEFLSLAKIVICSGIVILPWSKFLLAFFPLAFLGVRAPALRVTSDDMEGGFGLDNGIYDLETLQTELLRFGANVPRSQPLATWITPSFTPSTFR
ncbi:hypothetical protein TIFTF001_051729 [Ficus carica]|uniref:KIB1-4 beta-propeller domain-containing protein n=1 Tax=Ficus carica TaxID=3494 RepID=A0AA88CTU1_FICCA|nr:hypothetical protein TIFTF001_051729 [Ficus carica]